MIYRIKDWDSLYENNRTRDMKVMAWVPLSNRHDGDGYTDLVDRKNGAALFGAWVAIVQVASRCAPRGTLLRNGDANTAPSCGDVGTLLRRGAKPHDAASLSRMTRIPESIIKEMLEVCTNDCKWLETIESHDGAEIPQEGAPIPHPTDEEGNGKKEGNGMGGKHKCSVEELKAYCLTLSLPESDGEATFAKWEGNGWTNGNKKIVDWKATIRSWKLHGYLPSQKQSGNQAAKPESPQW